MRRSLAVLMTACLLSGALAGTADAGKKKKKGKKKPPITFEAEGSLLIGNPADFAAAAGLTRQDFLATCAEPLSQGLDGYVIELPEEFYSLSAEVLIRGADPLALYDLDLFFFSADCSPRGEQATPDSDELGFIAPDTKYIFVSAFTGAEITFDVTVTESK
ncbi:MAG: hypothetical protein ACR2KQ_03245 [Actinomycetota bacterium]